MIRRNRCALILLTMATIMSEFAASQSLAQTSYAVEGDWTCDAQYQENAYEYRLHVKTVGPKKWSATRTLIKTNEPLNKSIGLGAVGTIEVGDVYTAKFSGYLGLDDFQGSYEGTSKIRVGNRDLLDWDFTWKPDSGNTVVWKEQCFNHELPLHLPSFKQPALLAPAAQPEREKSRGESPNPPLEGSPAEILRRQLGNEEIQRSGCTKTIIATVFGYFEYDNEIDLTKGAQTLNLRFQPYSLPSGGSIDQAIGTYTTNARLSLQPDFQVASRSITAAPPKQPPRTLVSMAPLDWSWKVEQPWWSSVAKTDGPITVSITPPSGNSVDVSLRPMVKVTGKPWWWLVPWIWENILGKPEVSLVLLVFIVIAWRRGMLAACLWLWHRIKHAAG